MTDVFFFSDVIKQGVSPQQFLDLRRERRRRQRKWRFFYLAQDRLLTITIHTAKHVQSHSFLYSEISHAIRQLGLWDSWSPIHATTLSSNRRDGSSREGDSSGGPIPERMAGDAWPTLVIQSGVSQSLRDLQKSIRWWFSASDHDVKIVLLIKIDCQQQKVIIEKWTEGVNVPRPDATAVTRSATTLSPICRQEITIDISPAAAAAEPGASIRADAASYTVTGGDLRLEFELLFLRQSDAERDVIITADTLRDMGRILWYW